MPYINPLAEQAVTDPEDLALVARVQAGSPEALETLVKRHQPWIYNAAYGEIHRDHPFHSAPDFVGALRKLLDSPECRSLLAR